MLRLVAPVTLQERVELDPAGTVVGEAEKEEMTGLLEAGITVTVAGAMTLPLALVAVRV
jgi:hypothetical protein